MIWYNAKIRGEGFGCPMGKKVLVARNDDPPKSVGPCWYVYDGSVLRQAAESYAGRDGYHLFIRGSQFHDQDKANAKIPLLERSLRRSSPRGGGRRLKSPLKTG